MKTNVSITALVCAVLLVGFAVVALIFVPLENQTTVLTLVGLIVVAVPNLVSAAFSERASKDIRNGVLVKKVKEGAKQAIIEEQVMVRNGPVVEAELSALRASTQTLATLLEANTAATQINTNTLQKENSDG